MFYKLLLQWAVQPITFPTDDINGGTSTDVPGDTLDGGTSDSVGGGTVVSMSASSGVRPVFAQQSFATSIAKYGKVRIEDADYAALTDDSVKADYLEALKNKPVSVKTSVGLITQAVSDTNEDDEVRIMLTVAFVRITESDYGTGFDGSVGGEDIIDVTDGSVMGTVDFVYDVGDLVYYSKDSNQVVNVIFEPKTYTRDEGISYYWPNRPFDGEKVFKGKVALDLQGAPIFELDGVTKVTLQGPALGATATEDTIVWNNRRELWETTFLPSIDDVIYDNYYSFNTEIPTTYSIGRVSDWYSQQIAYSGIPWRSIAPRPGTSAYAQERNCSDDELNIVLYDAFGEVTGEKGATLNEFLQVSKFKGAKSVEGSNIYYKDVINRDSGLLFSNADIDAYDTSPNKVAPGTSIATGLVCELIVPRFGNVTDEKVTGFCC